MKLSFLAATVGAAIALGTAAQATVIFSEDFSDELAGAGGSVLNFTAFDQFSVDSGTVDLIGSGDFGITCGVSGACVDLDGSRNSGGFISSIVLNFLAGVTYTFDVVIGGNQRNDGKTDTGSFGISGGILDQNYSFLDSDALTAFSYSFSVAADTTGSVFFTDDGSDNVGAILDQVSVSSVSTVPLPATALLLVAGLGGLGAMRRRKKSA